MIAPPRVAHGQKAAIEWPGTVAIRYDPTS